MGAIAVLPMYSRGSSAGHDVGHMTRARLFCPRSAARRRYRPVEVALHISPTRPTFTTTHQDNPSLAQ